MVWPSTVERGRNLGLSVINFSAPIPGRDLCEELRLAAEAFLSLANRPQAEAPVPAPTANQPQVIPTSVPAEEAEAPVPAPTAKKCSRLGWWIAAGLGGALVLCWTR